jgi:transposase-like protein
MSTNLLELADRLRSEADAYEYLEELRWAGQPYCPHCGSVREHYFLKPANGSSRKTTRGSVSERRVWKCADCRKQFTVLTGTIFHGTKIPVRKWLLVIFDMASSKNGISAREIERKYGLATKTAWFMAHRIREAMKREPIAGLLSGRVISDETWYGGKPRNRHGHDPKQHVQRTGNDKTPIVALVSRETGEVRSQAVPDVTGTTLKQVLRSHTDPAQTNLHTDAGLQYRKLGAEFASHETVDHGAREYVRGDVTTNHAETYFSQLKRSLDGTHHHVSVEHLDRYLAEFDFRYSTCKDSDSERMNRIISRTGGRRLTYREPAGAYRGREVPAASLG